MLIMGNYAILMIVIKKQERMNFMQFSDKFEVEPECLTDYGAVNISLVCDIPLFVDPMLIFNSEKTEYKSLHENIIKYFHFLAKKALNPLGKAEIEAWFCFHEVHQNWLGYSLSGNKGSALAKGFGNFLYADILREDEPSINRKDFM